MYNIGRNVVGLPFIQHLLANFDKERFFCHLFSVCCDDGNPCSAKIIGNQFVQQKKNTTFPCYDITT